MLAKLPYIPDETEMKWNWKSEVIVLLYRMICDKTLETKVPLITIWSIEAYCMPWIEKANVEPQCNYIISLLVEQNCS